MIRTFVCFALWLGSGDAHSLTVFLASQLSRTYTLTANPSTLSLSTFHLLSLSGYYSQQHPHFSTTIYQPWPSWSGLQGFSRFPSFFSKLPSSCCSISSLLATSQDIMEHFTCPSSRDTPRPFASRSCEHCLPARFLRCRLWRCRMVSVCISVARLGGSKSFPLFSASH